MSDLDETTPSSTGRLNFRVRSESEARLRLAAEALGLSLTEFVVSSALASADNVLARHTMVPAEFFDEMMSALDQPWPSSGALRDAAQWTEKYVRQA